ncbi:hypothetical protein [Raineya sp.]
MLKSETMLKNYLTIFFFLLSYSTIRAQSSYTDYKPEYKKWHPDYMIDKIDYTENRMIIHFRYVANSMPKESKSLFKNFYTITKVTFFGKYHREKWYLENHLNPDEAFHFIDIKNIRRNGRLMATSIAGSKQLDYEDIVANEIFTCEIHFNRLPKHVKRVNLFEGEDYKHDQNHFHVLQIKVKQANDPELGNFSDMVKKVQDFERKLTGTPRSTFSVPKKENKPAITKKEEKIPVPAPTPVLVKKQNKPPQPTPKPRLHSPPTPPTYPQEAQARM